MCYVNNMLCIDTYCQTLKLLVSLLAVHTFTRQSSDQNIEVRNKSGSIRVVLRTRFSIHVVLCACLLLSASLNRQRQCRLLQDPFQFLSCLLEKGYAILSWPHSQLVTEYSGDAPFPSPAFCPSCSSNLLANPAGSAYKGDAESEDLADDFTAATLEWHVLPCHPTMPSFLCFFQLSRLPLAHHLCTSSLCLEPSFWPLVQPLLPLFTSQPLLSILFLPLPPPHSPPPSNRLTHLPYFLLDSPN